MSSGAELAVEQITGGGGPPRHGPSVWVWVFWGLVLLAALVTAFVVLLSSSAGAAGDCGGF